MDKGRYLDEDSGKVGKSDYLEMSTAAQSVLTAEEESFRAMIREECAIKTNRLKKDISGVFES
ncbi:hypothetical protein KBC04_02505 [Candidatus Babeliales bacterium]|nr:hypothetical protein [Candidatus Babeliales bacterium]MBP9843719.1 hypothetical protein [Candidatus Babeliales bacterium]